MLYGATEGNHGLIYLAVALQAEPLAIVKGCKIGVCDDQLVVLLDRIAVLAVVMAALCVPEAIGNGNDLLSKVAIFLITIVELDSLADMILGVFQIVHIQAELAELEMGRSLAGIGGDDGSIDSDRRQQISGGNFGSSLLIKGVYVLGGTDRRPQQAGQYQVSHYRHLFIYSSRSLAAVVRCAGSLADLLWLLTICGQPRQCRAGN